MFGPWEISMRILALDYGSKTVGVAVTDALGITAQGLGIIRREKENHLRSTVRRIGELIEEYDVSMIVLGFPINMDGTRGERAEKTVEFQKLLERRFHLPVVLCDERLTTVEAEEIMTDAGIRRRDFKKYVDQVAAEVILEDYLNNR